jgi:RNA polymerase sigma-70 factor (ECF subfamily)
MEALERFSQQRAHLFGLAYRMLGSAMDAEDILQEAFVRWQAASQGSIESDKAYLTTLVTRLCIDQLRSARARREEYVGPWLPEPLAISGPDMPGDSAILAESLSIAFLVLLERLNPLERAVLLLHDVFGYSFDEIAPIVGRQTSACRQIGHRAREHIDQGRTRFRPDTAQQQQLTSSFLQACASGNLQALMELLADDVTLWSDGGGRVRAALRPIYGADKVIRFLAGALSRSPANLEARLAVFNGRPGIYSYTDGKPFGVATLDVDGGRITAIWIVNNPDKQRALEHPAVP